MLIQEYVDYCGLLEDDYLHKHEEVYWYTTIIRNIRDRISLIITAHNGNNNENIGSKLDSVYIF